MSKTVLLLFLLAGTASAQVDTARIDPRSLLQYEVQKKDKGLAVLCWFIIPGGGYFYAGETGSGVAYLAIDAVLFAWAEGEKHPTIPVLGLVASRVLELIGTTNTIDEYNWALRQRLKLNIAVLPNGSAGLSFRYGL